MAPVVVVLVDGMLLRHLDDFVRLLECQGGFNVQRVCDVQLDQPQLLRLRTVSVASNGPPPLVLPPLCDLVRAVVLLLELDDSAYVTFERVARVLGQPLYGSADATQATIDVDVFLPLSAVNDLTLISGHLPNSYGSLHDTAGVVAPAPLLQLASLRSSPDQSLSMIRSNLAHIASGDVRVPPMIFRPSPFDGCVSIEQVPVVVSSAVANRTCGWCDKRLRCSPVSLLCLLVVMAVIVAVVTGVTIVLTGKHSTAALASSSFLSPTSSSSLPSPSTVSSSSESSSATQLGSGSASWSAPYSTSSSVAAESSSTGVQQTTVFQVSSYGAVPDDGLDDYSAIQSALDAAVGSGYSSTLVQLDAGSYNLSACLLIHGANGLTFSGVSAAMTTLVGNAMTCAVEYYTSTNIVLQQFTVDFYPLPFTAGVVSAVTSSSFDLTIVPPHPVMGMAGITTVNDVILYDEVNQRLPLGAVAQIPSGVYFEPGSSSSAVGNSMLRFQLSQQSNLVVGSALIVRYSPSNHAITGGTTSTITLRSVTIQASWCMAHAMQATNVVNIDVHVQPAPGRWLSTNFDGINYNDCRGELSVINSSVISNGDDGLSIHDDGWSIASVSNATTIATSSSYPDLDVGQSYWFSRAATPFSPYAMATVVAYISCSTTCSYQLERPGVPDAQVGDWMYSAQPPSLYVYNLTVRNNYARGMLLETANVVVEYSLFDHTYLPGIGVTLGADSTGDYSANVSISNCVFVGCNQGYREWYGQIALSSDPLQDGGVIRNVAITNNTFEMELWSGSVLSDYNGAGVLFQYNFANYSAPDNDPLVVFCNAQGWIIASNTFINVPRTAELYAFVQDTGCVTALSSGGVNTSDAFTACFGPSVVASPYGGGLAVVPSEVEDCNSMSVE